MITAIVGSVRDLKYARDKIYSGLLDRYIKFTDKQIKTEQDTWLFYTASKNMIFRMKGIKFDRIYFIGCVDPKISFDIVSEIACRYNSKVVHHELPCSGGLITLI